MIIIYLIITIFILLLLIFNNKEYFFNCEYVPWGPSQEFCKYNCIKGKWSGDLSTNSCNNTTCEKKCKECKNERCEWVSLLNRFKSIDSDNTGEDNDNSLLPNKLTIKQEQLPINQIIIKWDEPKPNPEPFDNNKYMIHILDLSNPLNKVDVFFINSDLKGQEGNITFKYGSEEIKINYIFENNRNYSINVYALNKYGISNASNTLII